MTGYSEHNVTGHVVRTRSNATTEGKLVVNVTIGVNSPGRDKDAPKTPRFYDVAFWGDKAKAFDALQFQKGDMLALQLDGVKPKAYTDKSGEIRTVLEARVQEFHDLRGTQKAGFSSHMIAGHIGKIRENVTSDGKPVVNVSVAVTPYRDAETTWHEIALFGSKAEAFQKCNFKVGDPIATKVQGLRAESYTNSKGELGVSLKANCVDFFDMRQRAKQDNTASAEASDAAAAKPSQSAKGRPRAK